MRPTVGRIVHFIELPGDPCEAAIVVGQGAREATRVDLNVFTDSPALDLRWKGSVMLDERKQHSQSWHWPEREED